MLAKVFSVHLWEDSRRASTFRDGYRRVSCRLVIASGLMGCLWRHRCLESHLTIVVHATLHIVVPCWCKAPLAWGALRHILPDCGWSVVHFGSCLATASNVAVTHNLKNLSHVSTFNTTFLPWGWIDLGMLRKYFSSNRLGLSWTSFPMLWLLMLTSNHLFLEGPSSCLTACGLVNWMMLGHSKTMITFFE